MACSQTMFVSLLSAKGNCMSQWLVRRHRFCFMAIAWRLPSAISTRWLKERLCMTTQPVFRLSLQLARVAADNYLHCIAVYCPMSGYEILRSAYSHSSQCRYQHNRHSLYKRCAQSACLFWVSFTRSFN